MNDSTEYIPSIDNVFDEISCFSNGYKLSARGLGVGAYGLDCSPI